VEIIPKATRAPLLPSSDRLLKLIEDHADALARELVETLQAHPSTPAFHGFEAKDLYGRAISLYHNLGQWISRKTEREDLAKYYTAVGAQRCLEGLPLSEVLHSFNLMRRVLWQKIIENGFLDAAPDAMQALELNHQLMLFFDRAVLFTARGYESAAAEK
jgi:hypothetical protein